jgi:hypothetical protein
MRRESNGNPGADGSHAGAKDSESNNGEAYNLNAKQRQPTPRSHAEWMAWGRYFDLRPEWENVKSGCGIAYTSSGHMNIHTWRLAVPGGWIYKVTERDEEGHFVIQICFVPGETKQ